MRRASCGGGEINTNSNAPHLQSDKINADSLWHHKLKLKPALGEALGRLGSNYAATNYMFDN